jgi:hypothetical protein
MKYQKPEVVLNGTAISAIEVGLSKLGDEGDVSTHTVSAYRSDE